MSDLTDNLFYPSTERIWLCICWNNAELSGPAIDLQKMPILAKKNNFFTWSSFWSLGVCKQAKLSYLGHIKPARIHWKTNAPKTRCGFWSRQIVLELYTSWVTSIMCSAHYPLDYRLISLYLYCEKVCYKSETGRLPKMANLEYSILRKLLEKTQSSL